MRKKRCKLCGEPTHYQYCIDCWQGISQWDGWLSDRKWNGIAFIQNREGHATFLGQEESQE